MSLHVMGEALIDLIMSPDGTIEAVPGGGPFNLARASARLGTAVTFAGGVSDDPFGRQIAEVLAADDVMTTVSTRVKRPTTLALAQLDEHGTATYTFYLDGTAGALVDAAELAPRTPVDAIAFGTLGIVMEPIGSAIEEVVAATPTGTLVFFDPNCRPSTVRDMDAFVDRVERLVAHSHVVKVSTDDVAFLYPGMDLLTAAVALRERGPRVVLLTDGGRAVVVVHAGGSFEVPVPTVEVVDSVGAGDSFGGAFLSFWLAAGRTTQELGDVAALQDTVARAAEVAAINCTRKGANPPTLAELTA